MTQKFWLKVLTWGTILTPLTLFIFRERTVYPLIFLKAFIFQIIVELLFLIWLTLILKYPEYRPKFKAVHIVLAVWIGVLILTAITGVNIERSFWSTQDRSIGIVFILHAFIFALIAETVVKKNGGWRNGLLYLTAIGAAMSGMAVMNRIAPTIFYSLAGDRPSGTLGNPSFLAGYLLFMLAIAAWLFTTAPKIEYTKPIRFWKAAIWILIGVVFIATVRYQRLDDVLYVFGLGPIVWGLYLWLKQCEAASRMWSRISVGTVIALYVVILFLANTRGALLALVAGLLIFLSWQALRDIRRRAALRSPAILILTVLVIFGGIFVGTRSATIWQKIPGFNRLAKLSIADATVNTRRVVWGIALDVAKEKPVLGWGYDNFWYAFDKHYNPALLSASSDETYWDRPHNVFLESLVTGGSVGFVAYMAVYGALFLALRRRGGSFKPFGYALFVAYAAQNFVLFDSFATYLMLFICAICVAGGDPNSNNESDNTLASAKKDTPWPAYALVIVAVIVVARLITLNAVTIYANTRQYNGLNYFLNRLPGEAIDSYRQGFELDYPYKAEIRQSYVASLKQMIGQVDIKEPTKAIQLAIDEYPKAIAEDPNNHFLYYTLADARTTFHRIDKKFLDGAEAEINKADELSPNRQQIYYVRSRIRLALGDVAGAIAQMQKAVDLNPDVGEPHFFHAILNVGTGSIDEINRELVRALDLGFQPRSTSELKLLYSYFMGNEQYALGTDYFSELDSNRVLRLEQQLYLGALAFKSGQYEKAASAFRIVAKEYSLFLATDRFNKEFKAMFAAVGITPEALSQ